MIPSDFSTAEMDHKGHITKQGNRRIRKFLVETSWITICVVDGNHTIINTHRSVIDHLPVLYLTEAKLSANTFFNNNKSVSTDSFIFVSLEADV